MKNFYLLFFAVLISCSTSNPEKEKIEIAERISKLSELNLTKYTLQKIVIVDNDEVYKIGDRKLIMSVEAEVKGGISLNNINKDSITINNDFIQLRLPGPKITSLNIDPEKINSIYEKSTYFRSGFSNEEKNQFLQQAEIQISEAVNDMGVLSQTQERAKMFFTGMLQNLGYTNIEIEFSK